MTDTATKAKIITQFTIEESTNPIWEEWFIQNDLGVPIAFIFTKGMVELNSFGVAVMEETWLALCRSTMADPNGNYNNLGDMLLTFDPTLDNDDNDDDDDDE